MLREIVRSASLILPCIDQSTHSQPRTTNLPHSGAGRLSTTGLLGCFAGHAAAYVLVETLISHTVVVSAGIVIGGSESQEGEASAGANVDGRVDREGVP